MHQPISSRTVLDQDYIAELEHRADTVGASPNGLTRPEVVFRDESESSAFLYELTPHLQPPPG